MFPVCHYTTTTLSPLVLVRRVEHNSLLCCGIIVYNKVPPAYITLLYLVGFRRREYFHFFHIVFLTQQTEMQIFETQQNSRFCPNLSVHQICRTTSMFPSVIIFDLFCR